MKKIGFSGIAVGLLLLTVCSNAMAVAQPAPVPEPGTVGLIGIGLAAVGLAAWRRRGKSN